MEGALRVFQSVLGGALLRQGEIISDLRKPLVKPGSWADNPIVDLEIQPYAMLITQDCDLEQDHRARQAGTRNDKVLPCLLFCEVFSAEELFSRLERNSKIWNRIKINKDERYHYVQKCEETEDALGKGLPELGIDFKRYFTLNTEEVYQQTEDGVARRRCKLTSPYLEHLSSRFAHYLSRVALPTDHHSD